MRGEVDPPSVHLLGKPVAAGSVGTNRAGIDVAEIGTVERASGDLHSGLSERLAWVAGRLGRSRLTGWKVYKWLVERTHGVVHKAVDPLRTDKKDRVGVHRCVAAAARRMTAFRPLIGSWGAGIQVGGEVANQAK